MRKATVDAQELVLADNLGEPIQRVPSSVRSALAYYFAQVDLDDDGLPRSLAVTSSLDGEGVTFLSRSIAAVVAVDFGKRTCWLDANFWAPDDALGYTNPGLAGLLDGSETIEDIALETNYENLDLVVRGDAALDDPGLSVGTEAFAGVLRALENIYECVVVDLPALSVTPGTLRASVAASSTLLVARHGVIRPDQVERATHDLRHARLLGVFLNDTRHAMPEIVKRRLIET